MKASILASAAVALALVAVPAAAQPNIHASPHFGTANLAAGFGNDPFNVSVVSGGSYNAANIGGHCRGYISSAPDYRLNFSAGGSLPLIISVNSGTDTTLVINAPDGRWYCDDDSGQGTNPSIRFGSPMSGRYEIWVGTYGSSGNASATLRISEMYSF